ncbi:MAG: hypothetical protein DMG59_10935 [Acidobacteria bacterium]|jgi:hypothetical protein|nr:MAG: hypothetical protein DMG59_10935 [Acidobacteriota bacterium]
MQNQWLAMEHYRLHTVEEWPDGPRKRTTLAAIRSSLESLSRYQQAGTDAACDICRNRKKNSTVSAFSQNWRIAVERANLAA